jgi:hypothetical protein
MNRITMFGVPVLAVAFLLSPGSKSLAQQPSSGNRVSMLCKIAVGGPGFTLVTLNNLTTSTIPKGQTLFAKKGNETIRFRAAEAIPGNGSATYRTRARAFQVFGECEGWY